MIAMSTPPVLFFSILSLLRVVYASVGRSNITLAPGGSNLAAAPGSVFLGAKKEMMYTSNSLCRQNYCTNPIFPGVNDLPRLEALQWQCATTSMVHQHMDFCKDAVPYDPALPSPASKATAVNELIKAQEDAAMTMFVYHLNGMGYEAWDYRNPSESDNDCVRSVWKMVCFTYFPRAEAGCKEGEQSSYKRPCKSSCTNYLAQCGVECCDESVQCVFAHTTTKPTGEVQLLQTGYVDQEGPSAMCTGSARRSMSSPLFMLLGIFGLHWAASAGRDDSSEAHRHTWRLPRCLVLGVLGVVALSLQGCTDVEGGFDIPQHSLGAWRGRPNYLNDFRYLAPGQSENSAVLNSCSQKDVPAPQQCNGRGYCRTFSTNGNFAEQANPLAFCQCNRDWADPECGTKRKSQVSAFFLSLFLGLFGADYFYLGFPFWGVGKLFTLGGLGFWWLVDVVRIASGPVYAYNYRVSHDLSHYTAVLILIGVFMLIGFVVAIQGYFVHRKKKRDDLSLLQHSEEARNWKNTQEDLAGFGGPRFRKGVSEFDGRPGFSGYGATMPLPHPKAATYASPPYAGPFGPAGIPGQGSPTPASMHFAAPTNMQSFGS